LGQPSKYAARSHFLWNKFAREDKSLINEILEISSEANGYKSSVRDRR